MTFLDFIIDFVLATVALGIFALMALLVWQLYRNMKKWS